ncbi:hypothetical protein Q3G72_001939 [Acer saccharum]|nr:hypothetical protein Q3G72_001939 [Acer saccharum]
MKTRIIERKLRSENDEKLARQMICCKGTLRGSPCMHSRAVARITCESVEKSGNYKTKVLSFLSPAATNVEGYFFATLPNSILNKDKLKITECKVLLESSPLKTCKVPTNINKGLTGSPRHTFTLIVSSMTRR